MERPLQFRLVHLFVLTTLSAVAAACFTAWGVGTLPMSVGLIAAWLNACGAFRAVQRGRRQAVLLWIAWVVYLLSLALPCMQIFSSPIRGWEAAWAVLGLPLNAVTEGKGLGLLGLLHSPGGLWYLLLNLANLLAVSLPLLIWRLRRGGGQWLALALCLAATGPWSVAWDGSMGVGYYVWCASFLIAVVALPLNRWQLAGMAAMALASVVVVLTMP